MSTTTKNVGRVSIVPKGDWNINNTYIRLDLVTYDGNSYIAKKDVPKNIQLSNNNYWMLMASKGRQGEQGEQGAPFAIMKSYASIAAMNADFSNTDVQNGQFVIIDTGNVQDPDNAKLYYKGNNSYVFVIDMSGAAGIQGPRGTSAYEQAVVGGYEGTEAQFNEDLADFKELSEQAASSATAADNSAKDAEAYAIGKRGDTDVESTDPTYHNNAKYYSEQAALIVDDVEQVMTSTTIGPTAFATFDASVASMPLKGLTVDIEPVQDFNGYSRPWLGGEGKNQLSLSMSYLQEKNTTGAWTNNSYVLNGVTFEVQLNNDNDVIEINVNGTASANTNFVFITRAPIPKYSMIENGCPSGGSNSKYGITTRMFGSSFGSADYYDYGSGLRLSDSSNYESFTSWITIYSGYIASNLVFRPMIRFYYDEDETFEPYSNICSITGWTGCKLHHTGVSLIGGDAFLGNAFTKTDSGYELTYGGSGIANRGSNYADISDIPAGRYVLQFLNCSYPEGIEVAFRRRTNGTLTSIGTIIGSSTSGVRAFDIPANTTELQFYIIPNSTVTIGDKVTMDDAILYRNGETAEPYKGSTYDITFSSPNPGTVYSGTLDVVNKKLIVTKKYALLNDPDKWSETGVRTFQYSDQFSDRKRYQTILEGFLCSCAGTSVSGPGLKARWIDNTDYFGFFANSPNNDSDILDKIKTTAANNKIAILYDLAEPLVYDITTEQVATLLGENNIWADCGDVTVTYGAYLETIKTYADRSADNAAAAETAQGAAEDAQEAAEAVLASIPSDYTELSEDVDDLKSAVDALENNDYNSLAYVYGGEGRIRHDNGLAVAGADYTYTDYLDISKYKSLRYRRVGTTSATGTSGMAFYNAGKSYVSGQQVALSQSQLGYVADLSEVPVPPDAVYARFSMLKNTDTYGTFEVFGYSEPTHQFNKIGNDLPVYKGSIANGVFSDSNYNVYISVSPRSTYKITADSRTVAYGALRSLTIPPVAGTSADYSQATGWTGARSAPPNTTVEGVLPDDANYLYVYYGTAGVSRLPAELKINGIDILDISGSLTENIAILADKVNKLHPKTEKTIAFFGDSIVAGSGVTGEPDSQIFHQYIHDLYGFTCLNYAYGGSGYARNLSPTVTAGFVGQGAPGRGVPLTSETALANNTVLSRLQSIQNPTFDAVVIFAGTNDWRHQDEYPYADFLTALENTFTYYQSNYGTIPLLVMTPIKRRGGDVVATERPKTMSDYRDAIIDMCKKYAVPYVDTMTYSGLNPDNTSNYNLFYMRDDTGELDIVHANHLAHQRIARVVGEVLNQLVLWNSDIVR